MSYQLVHRQKFWRITRMQAENTHTREWHVRVRKDGQTGHGAGMAGQGKNKWSVTLLHVLGVVGKRDAKRPRAGVRDTGPVGWVSRACRAGAFADLRDAGSAHPTRYVEEHVVTMCTCTTRGGG